MSVFAIDPDIVEIDTWRDAHRHRVRLFRDHRYEIEKLESLADSGTIVTLHQSMDAEKFDEHRRRLETALARWCRFAAVPIEFVSVDHDRNDAPASRRIDMPLSVPSSLYVQAHRDKERFVVGPSVGTDRFLTAGVAPDDPATDKPTFAGFYNRGLTLFETDEPLHPALTNVRLRVDSPHLRHTLSRDNVLRDRAFERIVVKARDLVEKSLRRELTSRMTRAARELAQSTPPYDAELLGSYVAFLQAALTKPLDVPFDEIMFPLAAPWKDSPVISLKQIMAHKGIHVVVAPDDLSRAMARVRIPVVLASDPAIKSLLALHAPLPGPISPENNFVLVQEMPETKMTASDRALCLAIENHLLALGLHAERVGIAHAAAGVEAPCIRMQRPARRVEENLWLCPKNFVERSWAQSSPRGPLLLVATNEAVQLAREHAIKDTFLAAHILLRLLLLYREDTHGFLSDSLFAIAATEVV